MSNGIVEYKGCKYRLIEDEDGTCTGCDAYKKQGEPCGIEEQPPCDADHILKSIETAVEL